MKLNQAVREYNGFIGRQTHEEYYENPSDPIPSINLSYNQITDISSSPFYYIGDLQKIDLSHNKITNINLNAFKCEKNTNESWLNTQAYYLNKTLKIIDLSFNKIVSIDLNALTKLEVLETVILSENPITNIADLRSTFPNIEFII
jgi:Leucine-rich repeat (LRR) protein